MPISKDRELTRDEALLALNDHLGDEVEVIVETDIETHAPIVMSAHGVPSHWRASDERGVQDTVERDDIAGLYDVGNASIDITELHTAYSLEDGKREGAYGLSVEVSPDVVMTVVWGV